MKHRIDPRVDFAFKLLLGTEENKDLLVHFLNAVLRPPQPIREVTLLDPFIPAQYKGDNRAILDVLATDDQGARMDVEIQMQVRPSLVNRMTYVAADMYQHQMAESGAYNDLRPVHSIWVLTENLFRGSRRWQHHFQLWDPLANLRLSDHVNVHTIELRKWHPPEGPLAPLDEWVYFLAQARRWTTLPPNLQSREMKKAMSVLTQISDRSENYYQYRARLDWEREQRTIEREREETRRELEQAQAAREQAQAAKEQERAAKEQAQAARIRAEEREERLRAETEALRARLRALGQDV